jgi:hypothetical protein
MTFGGTVVYCACVALKMEPGHVPLRKREQPGRNGGLVTTNENTNTQNSYTMGGGQGRVAKLGSREGGCSFMEIAHVVKW